VGRVLVNAISGGLLFVTDATTKGTTTLFMSKLGIIVLAVIVLATIKRSAFGHDPVSSNPPMSVKALPRRRWRCGWPPSSPGATWPTCSALE
jgi:hypothetical protein